MTDERAIRLAREWAFGGVCTLREGEAQEYHKRCLDALLRQQEQERSDTLNGWISVKDRLPVDERQVLTFVGYEDNLVGFITTSYYLCYDENPHWQWDAMLKDGQRTLFWMPLPEPPKEGM